MTRQLTTTAATMASVRGGTLWLVGEGSDCTEGDHCYTAHDDNAQHPPAEFVQACAPCERCDDTRSLTLFDRHPEPCTDCRIELVGPCPTPNCPDERNPNHPPLGYAYAVGQPLPIAGYYLGHECIVVSDTSANHCIPGTDPERYMIRDITDRLAHYGPPESLVGQWALQLALAVSA